MEIRYVWRGYFTNRTLNALHAEGFGHEPFDDDWEGQLDRLAEYLEATNDKPKRDGEAE